VFRSNGVKASLGRWAATIRYQRPLTSNRMEGDRNDAAGAAILSREGDRSVVELETIATSWLAMSAADTLDNIEAAALTALVNLTGTKIAYVARRQDDAWTITTDVGLSGDVRRLAIPESDVSYAAELRSGRTICYQNESEMGTQLARALATVGIGSLYAAPIMLDGNCAGALAIADPAASRFDARSRALVRLFTGHVGTLAANRNLIHSLETLAEDIPVIVLRTEPSGWINWYNKRWYEFTGQTREEASGWGWQTAHHPEDFLRVMEEWPKALATGNPIEIEFRLRRHDGVYHWHLARVVPVRNDRGEILSWYGSVVDIEAQKQALARTKHIADTLQDAFLPPRLPQRARLQVDAVYVSADEGGHVGGDWYDAFELPNCGIGFWIGDVGGHGLDASVTMCKLRQSILTLARIDNDPAHVLAEVNRILRLDDPETFVTAIAGFVTPDGSAVHYASAGHPPPIVASRRGSPAISPSCGGLPLGVVEELHLTTHVIPIETDEVIGFYTDGLTEYARNALEGEAQLSEALSTLGTIARERPAKYVVDAVLRGRRPPDDVALLIFQFSKSDRHLPMYFPSTDKEWRFHASDAKAAHVARIEVGDFLRTTCGDTEETFQSELIIGELLANTVEHAPGLVHLILEWTGDNYTLTVRDSGPGFESVAPELPSDIMSEGIGVCSSSEHWRPTYIKSRCRVAASRCV
jgi:PAS domain S-box-containing protein